MKPHFSQLLTKTEIKEFQSFVFGIYCNDLHWHDPDDYPDGFVSDVFDQYSVFIAARNEGKIMCGFRLVSDSHLGFPQEEILANLLPNAFLVQDQKVRSTILPYKRSEIVTLTRVVSAGSMRRQPYTVDFIRALYFYAVSHNIKAYYMVIDMSFFLLCEKLGIFLEPISLPLFYEGSWTVPSMLSLDSIHRMAQKNPLWKERISDSAGMGFL